MNTPNYPIIPTETILSWRYGIVSIAYDDNHAPIVNVITPMWLDKSEAEKLLAETRQADPCGDYDLIVDGQ